ncbi:hypothetical protein POTOM_032572 [Populus tomentosa]|uniref:Uncharacterized protein n=1 Tax=Populus tomentosa TaxID=118781 RepID=A0A8X7Z6E3_POPTO|nr:hypothetical protein POTOM_032572 [Populus tomentosa]
MLERVKKRFIYAVANHHIAPLTVRIPRCFICKFNNNMQARIKYFKDVNVNNKVILEFDIDDLNFDYDDVVGNNVNVDNGESKNKWKISSDKDDFDIEGSAKSDSSYEKTEDKSGVEGLGRRRRKIRRLIPHLVCNARYLKCKLMD